MRDQPAKMLALHFTERDRHDGKPLYEAIVEKCRELKIAGATVFRGLEGYGDTADRPAASGGGANDRYRADRSFRCHDRQNPKRYISLFSKFA